MSDQSFVLIKIWKLTARITQVWYADNAESCGIISDLREWWNQVSSLGPFFGYFPNANKTWLVTKQQYCSIGREIFCDTTVNVTSDGKPHLGVPVGTTEYVEKFTLDKIDCWISEINKLSSVAISQLYATYTSFTHGLSSRWLYVSRTVPDTSSSFHKLEKALLTKFIPALTGLDSPGTLQRSLFALPIRLEAWALLLLILCHLLNSQTHCMLQHHYDCTSCHRISTMELMM